MTRILLDTSAYSAATALEHDLRLVTLDRHFLHVPQILVKHIAAG
jgi:predicted nucleic acid-binding protein